MASISRGSARSAGRETVTVPGAPTHGAMPTGILAGLGVFGVALAAVTACVTASSGEPSFWLVPIVALLVTGGFVASLLANHLGRAGTVRLTRQPGGWAALSSAAGGWAMLLAAVLTALTSAAFLLLVDDPHLVVWLLAALGVVGVIDGVRRRAQPLGWYLDPHGVTATTSRGRVAYPWEQLDQVALTPRGLTLGSSAGSATLGFGEVASDPATLAAVAEYYRTHPAARAELADDRFLERLRAGRLG